MLWSSGIIFIVQFITLLVTCLLCRNIVNLKSDFLWRKWPGTFPDWKYQVIASATYQSWFRKKTWTPQVDRDLIFETKGKRIWLSWWRLCTGKLPTNWHQSAMTMSHGPGAPLWNDGALEQNNFQLYLTQNITIGDIVYTAADPSAK